MGDKFTNSFATLTTTLTNYYTVPEQSSSVVVHLQVANAHSQSNNEVTVAVSSSSGLYYLAKDLVVPYKSSVGILTGQLILSSSNALYASVSSSTSPDRMDMTIGVIENYA